MTAGRDTTPNAHAVDHPGGGSAATLASSSSADDESSAPSPLMDHAAAMPPDDGSLSDEEWLKRALDAARERDLVRDRLETLAASDDDGGDAADRELDRIVDDDASRAIVRGGDAPGAVDRAAATAFGGWIPCDADADRTLLVDNYDSYTYNLYHLIAVVDGALPVVVRNDAIAWRQLAIVVTRRALREGGAIARAGHARQIGGRRDLRGRAVERGGRPGARRVPRAPGARRGARRRRWQAPSCRCTAVFTSSSTTTSRSSPGSPREERRGGRGLPRGVPTTTTGKADRSW